MGVRIVRDQMLMEMAEIVAKRGTCDRLQVGAVISQDGRVISTGYNGAPTGLPHCDHSHDVTIGYQLPDVEMTLDEMAAATRMTPGESMVIDPMTHRVKSVGCTRAVHAEANAVVFAARHGVALDGSTLHVTHMPCLNCARLIINAGIKFVFYLHPYRITDGVELLRSVGIRAFDMTNNVG